MPSLFCHYLSKDNQPTSLGKPWKVAEHSSGILPSATLAQLLLVISVYSCKASILSNSGEQNRDVLGTQLINCCLCLIDLVLAQWSFLYSLTDVPSLKYSPVCFQVKPNLKHITQWLKAGCWSLAALHLGLCFLPDGAGQGMASVPLVLCSLRGLHTYLVVYFWVLSAASTAVAITVSSRTMMFTAVSNVPASMVVMVPIVYIYHYHCTKRFFLGTVRM